MSTILLWTVLAKKQKHGNVKSFLFSSAGIEDINKYIIPIIKKQPDCLVLHEGTNDATTNISKKITEDLLTLKSNVSEQILRCRIVQSKPIIQHDMVKQT